MGWGAQLREVGSAARGGVLCREVREPTEVACVSSLVPCSQEMGSG